MNSLGAFELVLILAFVTVWIWSIVWAAQDAGRRGKSRLLVGLLVALLSWPLGLIVWLIFRPAQAAPKPGLRG